MGVVWRWGAITGGLVVLVDLIAAMLSSGQPDTNPRVQAAQIIDLLVNLTLYAFCGYRVGGLTKLVRSAAEAGVTAGVIAGAAAVIVGQLLPPPLGNPPLSPVSGLALNVAMGGLLSFGFGFAGSRSGDARVARPARAQELQRGSAPVVGRRPECPEVATCASWWAWWPAWCWR